MIRYELKDLENIANRQAGIYILCDDDNTALYVGRSVNLRNRLDFKRLEKLYIPNGVKHAYTIFKDQIISEFPRKLEYTELVLIHHLTPRLNKKYHIHQVSRYKESSPYF